MSDQHRDLLLKLSELRKMVDEATLGPWRSTETKDAWCLHGEARKFKGKTKDGIAPSMQILKAAKRNTPYAEYWPNDADGALIVGAANYFPFFLDWAEDVAARHYPVVCGCRSIHFLCAANRIYSWEECPEVRSLVRAVDKLHIGEGYRDHE